MRTQRPPDPAHLPIRCLDLARVSRQQWGSFPGSDAVEAAGEVAWVPTGRRAEPVAAAIYSAGDYRGWVAVAKADLTMEGFQIVPADAPASCCGSRLMAWAINSRLGGTVLHQSWHPELARIPELGTIAPPGSGNGRWLPIDGHQVVEVLRAGSLLVRPGEWYQVWVDDFGDVRAYQMCKQPPAARVRALLSQRGTLTMPGVRLVTSNLFWFDVPSAIAAYGRRLTGPRHSPPARTL